MSTTEASTMAVASTSQAMRLPARFRFSVVSEIQRTFASWTTAVWVALILAPIAWTATKDAVFAFPLSAFATSMESPLSVVLPLIAVGIYLFRLGREMQERFIVNARARIDVRRYLMVKAQATALTAFMFFFTYAAVSFIAMVYILPPLGVLRFDPTGSVPPEQFARFSELWSLSPALYGLVYAAWCGLNGTVWALIGLIALLSVPNRLVALAVPVVGVLVLTVALTLFGLDIFAPYPLWILFGYVQSPAWTALAPMGVLVAATLVGTAVVIRRSTTSSLVQ